MGAQTVYRYKRRGVTADQFDNVVGTTPTAVGLLSPSAFQDLTYDADFHTGAVAEMAAMGWEFVVEAPPAGTPLMVAQTSLATLASNSSSIPVASGWTDVSGLSVSLTTIGGTKMRVRVEAAPASIAIGGAFRALINGGSFSNQVVQTLDFKLSLGQPRMFNAEVTIPSTSGTTYTVRVQAQGVGVLSSVSLEAIVSSLAVTEYSS